jgi:hypothetical protein
MIEDQSNEPNEDNESNGDDFDKGNELKNNNSDEDDKSENNNSENFEDYSCPPFELYQDLNVNPIYNKFLWILLWIMKF